MDTETSSINALESAFQQARQALKLPSETVHGVCVRENNFHNYSVALFFVGDSSSETTFGRVLTAGKFEVEQSVRNLAKSKSLPSLELVFMSYPDEDPRSRKWVLMEPASLRPRLIDGKTIESTFTLA